MSIEQGGVSGSKSTDTQQQPAITTASATGTTSYSSSPTHQVTTSPQQPQAHSSSLTTTTGDEDPYIGPSASPNAPSGSRLQPTQGGTISTTTHEQPISTTSSTRTSTISESAATTATTTTITSGGEAQSQVQTQSQSPRQVIAVSASKQPSAFFNLARRFLVSDESCDLSALEGAIVTAVDTAHLLERSKLAKIIRIQTSYVSVEPKRKPQRQGNPPDTIEQQQQITTTTAAAATSGGPINIQSHPVPAAGGVQQTSIQTQQQPPPSLPPPPIQKPQRRTRTTPLRRARLIITVQRTNDYETWLEENPHPTSGEDDLDVT